MKVKQDKEDGRGSSFKPRKKGKKGNRGPVHPKTKNINTSLSLPGDYPWKVLNWMIEDLESILPLDDVLLLKQIVRDRDISSYQLLNDSWGLQAQNEDLSSSVFVPHSDVPYSVIAARYQLSALIRKYRFDSDKKLRQAAALSKFMDAEATCKSYNAEGIQAFCKGSEFTADVLTHSRNFLVKLLGTVCPTKEILTRWSRHGPGSNLDTCKGNVGKYFKYSNWPYSCTSRALPYARFVIATDKRWLGALEDSYRTRKKIPVTRILNQDRFWSDVLTVVEGNRIGFVPKSAEIDRSIAVEPTMNLFLQLGVDGFIRNRLKRFDVNLDSQVKNQLFARLGSKSDSNESYCTLDLAAASDTISLSLCKLLLPDEWYTYLTSLRSPRGTVGKESLVYEKISSMGNGYTFVLESAIFAALSYAAIKTVKGTCDMKEDLCVFGDDLIVPKDMSTFVVRALTTAGFAINTEKSFFNGPIRESCGTDWIQGLPLRPIFMKKMPENVQDLFVDLNRLQRNLALRFGIRESNTVRKLKAFIPKHLRDVQGPYSDEQFDSYVHTPFPKGKYECSLWKYPILVREPVKVQCDDFLMRKLMHDLRPKGEVSDNHWVRKRTVGGNRFAVTRSYSYTVSKSHSIAGHWAMDYADSLPG